MTLVSETWQRNAADAEARREAQRQLSFAAIPEQQNDERPVMMNGQGPTLLQ